MMEDQFNARKFEVLEIGNQKHKLTITPNRVTVKLAEDSTPEDSKQVVDFCKRIADAFMPEQSFRGKVSIYEGKCSVTLYSDNKKLQETFRDDQVF